MIKGAVFEALVWGLGGQVRMFWGLVGGCDCSVVSSDFRAQFGFRVPKL